MAAPVTRRGALTGAAAITLAACGSQDPARRSGPAPGSGAALLNSLLASEHAVSAAYAALGEHLRGEARVETRRIVEQEREHARRVARLVRGLGGAPVSGRSAREYAASFPRLRDAADALLFAEDLEERQLRGYLDALAKLPDPELRREAMAIAVNEAEHLAVVRALAGAEPAPEAFVTGTA